MSSALVYALVAALGNLLGALAVTRRAARGLAVIEHFVAFGAGFMLAVAAGVTIYVAASNLVPEFQGKRGWRLPAAFFAGAGVFVVTKLVLDNV